MGAIDRVTHILPGRDDSRGGQEEGHGEVVVQPEDDIVVLDVAEFDQVLDAPEDAEHLEDLATNRSDPILTLDSRALDCH